MDSFYFRAMTSSEGPKIIFPALAKYREWAAIAKVFFKMRLKTLPPERLALRISIPVKP